MRKLHSVFEKAEVFIARGQKLASFMPALRIDNAGGKPAIINQPAASPQPPLPLHSPPAMMTSPLGDDN